MGVLTTAPDDYHYVDRRGRPFSGSHLQQQESQQQHQIILSRDVQQQNDSEDDEEEDGDEGRLPKRNNGRRFI